METPPGRHAVIRPDVPRLRSLDEMAAGQVFEIGTLALSRDEIVAFAARFDPQPFHLDEAAAEDSIFRGLVASGLHTLSATFGLLMHSPLLRDINLGGSAMEIAWPAPLRPDERVEVRLEVREVIPSRSRADRGKARLRYLAARAEDGVTVLDATGLHILRR